MTNLHKIFTKCKLKNSNSKHLDKIWMLVKIFLTSGDVMLTS